MLLVDTEGTRSKFIDQVPPWQPGKGTEHNIAHCLVDTAAHAEEKRNQLIPDARGLQQPRCR